jgi:hypothetical protein
MLSYAKPEGAETPCFVGCFMLMIITLIEHMKSACLPLSPTGLSVCRSAAARWERAADARCRDAQPRRAVRPTNPQQTKGTMATVTPHHYGYTISIITIGFPYANTKFLVKSERMF